MEARWWEWSLKIRILYMRLYKMCVYTLYMYGIVNELEIKLMTLKKSLINTPTFTNLSGQSWGWLCKDFFPRWKIIEQSRTWELGIYRIVEHWGEYALARPSFRCLHIQSIDINSDKNLYI